MSKRELKALLADGQSCSSVGKLATSNHNSNRRTRSNTMDSAAAESTEELRQRVEILEHHLREAQAQVQSKTTELQEVRHERDELEDQVGSIRQELDDALSSDQVHREHADRLASELELSRLQFELDKLRTMESLRAEHQSILDRELRRAEELRQEKKRSDEKIIWLESQLKAAVQPRSNATETEQQMDPLEPVPVTTQYPSNGYSVAVEEQRAGSVSPTCYYYPGRKVEQELVQTLPQPQTVSIHEQEVSNEGPAHTTEHTLDPMAKCFQPTGASKELPPLLPQASLLSCGVEQPTIVQSMTKLLQAQTEMISAQAHAVAIQSLPALPHFAGQDVDSTTDEDSFDRWLEQFEERSRLAGWTSEQQLCQLKAHLEKTALQVFRMLTTEERSDYTKAIGALRKRFKPVAIEELRGMEFHQLMQDSQSIEQLGIELQRLARKAFPSISGKEQDILLKGRFYQALLPRWQRKLTPKPEETFAELYDRARTVEKHEKQYAASAAARADNAKSDKKHVSNYGKQKSNQRVPHNNVATKSNMSSENLVPNSEKSSVATQKKTAQPVGASQSQITCYRCGETGHYARNCKSVPSKSQNEAPGKSSTSTSRSAAIKSESSHPQKFTEEQLEEMLARVRLEKEASLLHKQTAKVDTVSADEGAITEAVGPTLYIDLTIEGVPVQAMVDTGSQSTIISRDVLHKVGRHLASQGKPLPQLQVPTVRLYGKDGKKTKSELNISAEALLTMEADGARIQTPVFIQPDSDQPCLLGMNAAPTLNLQFLRANGQPLRSTADSISTEQDLPSAKVCLVESTTIPARKGRFLEATIEPSLEEGAQVLFEPSVQSLQAKGLSTQEVLLTVAPSGNILIPLLNMEFSNSDVKAGDVIGTVELMEEVADNMYPTSSCAQVEGQPQPLADSARRSKLKQQLKLPELQADLAKAGMSTDQVKEIEKVLLDADDVFALDESELGQTSLVTHSINTGDHPPIKQQPRRTPFCHKEKISQLVNDMLEKKVIQPSSSA